MVGAATTGGTVIKGGSIRRVQKPWAMSQAIWGRGPFYMTIFSLPVTKGPLEFPASLLGAKWREKREGSVSARTLPRGGWGGLQAWNCVCRGRVYTCTRHLVTRQPGRGSCILLSNNRASLKFFLVLCVEMFCLQKPKGVCLVPKGTWKRALDPLQQELPCGC